MKKISLFFPCVIKLGVRMLGNKHYDIPMPKDFLILLPSRFQDVPCDHLHCLLFLLSNQSQCFK